MTTNSMSYPQMLSKQRRPEKCFKALESDMLALVRNRSFDLNEAHGNIFANSHHNDFFLNIADTQAEMELHFRSWSHPHSLVEVLPPFGSTPRCPSYPTENVLMVCGV